MSRSTQLPNLDKLFRDDDDQDFTPQGGSNLAAIFGGQKSEFSPSVRSVSQKKSNSGRSTPQSTSSSSPSTNKTEVIIAKVVHAYKLINNQYSLIGKLGIALTGNIQNRTYLLILYKTKQEHTSVVTLNPEFSFTIRENNYASYYDGNNENWSILFESSEGSIEFAREIGLIKYFLKKEKIEDSVFFQDLTAITKEEENKLKSAEENDEIEINYMIFQNITQPLKLGNIPIQNMKIQISSDENWEKSLLGVKKTLKRLLILPPSKQISLGPGYPREKDIAMEIEIVEIIKPEIKRIPSPKPPVPSGKASLISRMAKMGQSMLPKLPTSTTTDSEDTEEEIQIKSPNRRTRNSQQNEGNSVSSATTPTTFLVPKNLANSGISSPHGSIVPTTAFAHSWTSSVQPQQFMSSVDGQFYPLQAPMIPQIPVDPNINVFLSESRTHNAEIRMGMSKISDNVQKLLDKFHVIEMQNAVSPSNERALEASLKMLISMNLEKSGKSNELCDNSIKLENGTNLIESRETIKLLENELKTTKKLLNDLSNKLEKMDEEKEQMKNEKSELLEKIEKLEKSQIENIILLQKSLSDFTNSNNFLIKQQRENAILQEKIITLENEKKIIEKNTNLKKKDHEIKQIMNKTYQILIEKFTESSYSTEFIKNVIAETIRSITLNVLKEEKNYEIKDNEIDDNSVEKEQNNVTSTLPDIKQDSDDDKKNVMSNLREDPPPIPPMDLDIENDWLS